MKHTPGPWKWDEDSLIRISYGQPIIMPIHGDFGSVSIDINEEDANLIAAAPDLLEAHRKIINLCKEGQELTIDEAIDIIAETLILSKDAVAKAEGK